MNMFELHDFLHSNFKAGADLGDLSTSTLENVKIKGGISPSVVNTQSNQPGSPFPWKTLLIVVGIPVVGYFIFDTFFPINNKTPNIFERRRLAREKSSSQN